MTAGTPHGGWTGILVLLHALHLGVLRLLSDRWHLA